MSRAFLDRSSQNDSNSNNNNTSQQKEDFEAQMKKLDMNINNPGWDTSDISPAQMFAEEEEERQAKKREEEELQMKPEEENLQRMENPNNPGTKTTMPNDLQSKMENSFGVDFSDVNIHKDSEQAPSLGALAYTQGNDMHFAPGQYEPGSQKGQELLGHELAHVVQQREGRVKPGGQQNKADANVNTDEGLEKEEDEQGKQAAQGKMADVIGKEEDEKVQAKKGDEKGAKTAQSEWDPANNVDDFYPGRRNLDNEFDQGYEAAWDMYYETMWIRSAWAGYKGEEFHRPEGSSFPVKLRRTFWSFINMDKRQAGWNSGFTDSYYYGYVRGYKYGLEERMKQGFEMNKDVKRNIVEPLVPKWYEFLGL